MGELLYMPYRDTLTNYARAMAYLHYETETTNRGNPCNSVLDPLNCYLYLLILVTYCGD